MPEENSLSQEAFQYLARQAGLPEGDSHTEELLRYVQNVLAPLQSVRDIDVAGAEPDMAFIPPRGE
ncbi:MAG: hypothetical protein ACE5Q6_06545 [Dehalococcoidia bacterium]